MCKKLKEWIATKTKDAITGKVFDYIIFTILYEFLRRQAMKLPFDIILKNNFWFQFFTEPFFISIYAIFLTLLLYWLFLFVRSKHAIKYQVQNAKNKETLDDLILSNILTVEDIKMLSYCYYDDKTKQFYFCKSRELYRKYYVEQKYYSEFNHSVKFDKYQRVSIDFLPRKAKSIKVRFWNVCDKIYDDDPYIIPLPAYNLFTV